MQSLVTSASSRQSAWSPAVQSSVYIRHTSDLPWEREQLQQPGISIIWLTTRDGTLCRRTNYKPCQWFISVAYGQIVVHTSRRWRIVIITLWYGREKLIGIVWLSREWWTAVTYQIQRQKLPEFSAEMPPGG